MQTKSYLTVLTAVVALGFAAASQSAFAQSDDTVSVKVSFADLNPSTDAGAKVMLRRIRNAANSICGPAPTNPIDRMMGPYDTCIKETVSQAVSQLNSPLVTALYSGKTKSAGTILASAR